MIILLFLSNNAPNAVIPLALHFTCGDGFSGRFHVAITTRIPPNNSKIPTALCLFLFIINLSCFTLLTGTIEWGKPSAIRRIDWKSYIQSSYLHMQSTARLDAE
jgi:hypothetical protein